LIRYLYSFGVLCYAFIIKLLSPFNKKAKLWTEGRKDVFTYLQKIYNQIV